MALNAKANPNYVPKRINGKFAPGYSGNPGGSLEATRRSFNKDFLLALAADFKKHGAAAIEKVRKQQPAAYMKICALLVPREMQIEHSGGVKAMTDEQLEHALEAIESLMRQRGMAALIGGSGSHPELAGARKRRHQDAQGLRSASPKVLEPVRRHFGVSDGVLNVLVPEVMLQCARVVAIVGELKTAGMAQHVWVDREWHVGSLADALDEPVEPDRAHWPAALGNEYVGVFGVITP